jgi:predicted glutamine amidotransferase
MCQLLGLSSNKKVNIQLSLREFRKRGIENSHGWGFAFYQDRDWNVIKKTYSLSIENVKGDEFKFKSKMIIGHVRYSSCGNRAHQNTHPFKKNGWVFAHNGTVKEIMNKSEYKLENIKPEGETDSEYAFCYLLEKINNKSVSIRKTLFDEARKIKQHGNFNFLLSDGEILYAHGDNSLHYVQREAPFEIVTLEDEQYSINLNEIKDADEKAVIIATEPLTENEDWKKFVGVKIFRNGEECEEP